MKNKFWLENLKMIIISGIVGVIVLGLIYWKFFMTPEQPQNPYGPYGPPPPQQPVAAAPPAGGEAVNDDAGSEDTGGGIEEVIFYFSAPKQKKVPSFQKTECVVHFYDPLKLLFNPKFQKL